jgi:Fe2+ or Zn2+ uptake regulation protein
MGIYNLVNFQIDCPTCNALITQFQTKEGDGVFEIIEFTKVNNFHAICQQCQSLVEFYFEPEKQERTIADYKMRVIKLGRNGK